MDDVRSQWRRISFRSPWRCWYSTAVILLHASLCWRAVKNFYMLNQEHSWISSSADGSICLSLISMSIVLASAFLVTGYLRFGFHDNEMGDYYCTRLEAPLSQRNGSIISTIVRYGPPIAPLLHVMMAMLLIGAHIIMEAVMLKKGYFPRSRIWQSDLDVIFSALTKHEFFLDPRNDVVNATRSQIGLEILNLILALMMLSIYYASSIWQHHRVLSMLYSVQLLSCSIFILTSLFGFTVLFKLHVVGIHEIFLLPPALTLTLNATVGIFIFTIILTSISNVPFYMHVHRMLHRFPEENRSHLITASSTSRALCQRSCFPHCLAMSSLVTSAIATGFLLHDCGVVYKMTSNRTMLVAASAGMIHHLIYLLVWIGLALRRNNFEFSTRFTTQTIPVSSPKIVLNLTRALRRKQRRLGDKSSMLVVGKQASFEVEDITVQRWISNLIIRNRKEDTNSADNFIRLDRVQDMAASRNPISVHPGRFPNRNASGSRSRARLYCEQVAARSRQPLSTSDESVRNDSRSSSCRQVRDTCYARVYDHLPTLSPVMESRNEQNIGCAIRAPDWRLDSIDTTLENAVEPLPRCIQNRVAPSIATSATMVKHSLVRTPLDDAESNYVERRPLIGQSSANDEMSSNVIGPANVDDRDVDTPIGPSSRHQFPRDQSASVSLTADIGALDPTNPELEEDLPPPPWYLLNPEV